MREHDQPKGTGASGGTNTIEHIPVVMVREHMRDLPAFELPSGFTYRYFTEGDESHWAEIETRAGEFPNPADARAHFSKEFGAHTDEMRSRCVFIVDETTSKPVGTATAWHGEWDGVEQGRLHWVGLVPELHGRGLGKAIVSLAMHRMASLHTRAYLTTQTTSFVAIKIYLDFGFTPVLKTAEDRRGWDLVKSLLYA
ncbi:MAG: GNAT family N-acetyltransferase [Spirochaetaceae bacterium]|nr:MAG: GNAT family N-acetyltransferase [Spirochaetaceae bacterium]